MADALDILSPYDASIDLSTSEGQKLFRAASREGTKDDERVVVSMGTAKSTLEHFIDEESSFSLHSVTNIPIEFELTYNSSGDVDGCKVTRFCNILREVNTLTLAGVQRSARCIWGSVKHPILVVDDTAQKQIDEYNSEVERPFAIRKLEDASKDEDKKTLQWRIRSLMLAKNIQNTVNKDFLADLRLKKDEYTWTDESGKERQDGGTMLYLLLHEIYPSTRVRNIKQSNIIEKARLEIFHREGV